MRQLVVSVTTIKNYKNSQQQQNKKEIELLTPSTNSHPSLLLTFSESSLLLFPCCLLMISSCFPWLIISSCCLNKPCLLLGLLWTHPMILSLSLFLVQSIWSPLVTLHLLSQTLCWGQNGNFSSLRLLFASIAIDISWSATHSSPSHCCRHWRKLREYLMSPSLISREWQPTITATRFRRSLYIFLGSADGPLASPRPLRLASLAAGGAHTPSTS